MRDESRYYLYGTTESPGTVPSEGFFAYYSTDLNDWTGPFETFAPFEGFWADRDYWAPEVHRYKGKFYMFASFKGENKCRGTQILVADTPLGPFVPNSDGPATPSDWECLDGTLYVDGMGSPWMVFCHEWTQVGDGEMCAVRLSERLDTTLDEPILLFTASQAPWAVKLQNRPDDCFVTDGPFLYRTQDGKLLMLWSSFSGNSNYSLGIARSESGDIRGPWIQNNEPLYARDGGHAMLFETFDNRLLMALHTPNNSYHERAVFLDIKEENGMLFLSSAETVSNLNT